MSQRSTDVTALFAAVEKEFGRLDILVNNAGMFFPAKFEELTEEQWDRILDTNLKSQFLCSQAAAPMLRRSGHGRIINFASLGGLLAWPAYTHYCVSKAGVIMLTRCLARALAPEITVNAIAPGTISFPGDAPETCGGFHPPRAAAAHRHGERHRRRRRVSRPVGIRHRTSDRRRWGKDPHVGQASACLVFYQIGIRRPDNPDTLIYSLAGSTNFKTRQDEACPTYEDESSGIACEASKATNSSSA